MRRLSDRPWFYGLINAIALAVFFGGLGWLFIAEGAGL